MRFNRGAGRGEVVGEAAQQLRVDEDAFHLHGGQHRHQRAFQRLVNGELAHRGEARLQQQPEAQGDVGILRRIARGVGNGHQVEGDQRLAGACDLLEGDALVIEMALREFVHAVADVARLEHVGDEHRVIDGADGDSVALEHLDIVLEVLPDLEDGRILEQRLQHREGFGQRHLAIDQLATE